MNNNFLLELIYAYVDVPHWIHSFHLSWQWIGQWVAAAGKKIQSLSAVAHLFSMTRRDADKELLTLADRAS